MKMKESALSWDSEQKLAAVFYLYLSLDKAETEQEKKEKEQHLEALFDLRQALEWYLVTMGLKTPDEKLPEDEDGLDRFVAARLGDPEILESHCLAFGGFAEAKEEIVKACEEAIAEFDDAERYERIVEEIDSLLSESPRGDWTDGVSFDAPKRLWVFALYAISAGLYTDAKKKFLKHYCRLAEISGGTLAGMENEARSLVAIGERRLAIKVSDEAYSKAAASLAALDTEEEAAQETVRNLLGLNDSGEDGDDYDGEVYKDDRPFGEQLGEGVCNVLNSIADGLEAFAARI